MKPRTQVMFVLAALLAVVVFSSLKNGSSNRHVSSAGTCCSLISALDAKPTAAGTNQIAASTSTQQTIAYYFHGTVRCETCLLIEAHGKAVIEQQFSADLAAHRLVFMPVNYELPDNTHFLSDYKLPCPSLVLVRQTGGKDEEWKLLGETWQLVHDPLKFNAYVEAEVKKFLSGEENASSNEIELQPAPRHR